VSVFHVPTTNLSRLFLLTCLGRRHWNICWAFLADINFTWWGGWRHAQPLTRGAGVCIRFAPFSTAMDSHLAPLCTWRVRGYSLSLWSFTSLQATVYLLPKGKWVPLPPHLPYCRSPTPLSVPLGSLP
jgi:hypothetical protein